jgi:circadian clock protein KaiC
MHDEITDFEPRLVVIDPISNLSIDHSNEVKPTLMRLIDILKRREITAIFTSLVSADSTYNEQSEVGVSSLMDTWLLLRNIESNGERNRALFVIKSRGMEHSNKVREFIMSDTGINLVDVYMGPDGILVGSARAAHEKRMKQEAMKNAVKAKRPSGGKVKR